MNQIEITIANLKDLIRKTEIQSQGLIETLDKVKEELIEESYRKGLVENLVNISYDINHNICYIGDMSWGEHYEILTGTRYYEDVEFETEEQYQEWVINDINKRISKYTIRQIDKDNWGIYDEFDDVIEEGFSSRGEAKDRLEEWYDEFRDEYPAFEDLDMEYDEIYWNYVYGYDNIDIDIAKKCGLGVLEMYESGEKYLFLRGCGMDMSFQLVQYQALYFGAISNEYLHKLDWTKQNLPKDEYEEVLQKLGVDIQKLGVR